MTRPTPFRQGAVRPVQLRIEPREPGRTQDQAADEGIRNRQICSRWLPEMTRMRDLVWCVTLAMGLPYRYRMVMGPESGSMGICACFARPSLRELSSVPESTRSDKGREMWGQSRVPRREEGNRQRKRSPALLHALASLLFRRK